MNSWLFRVLRSIVGAALLALVWGVSLAQASSASIASCTPGSGSMALGQTVACTFTTGTDGSRFLFWSAPGFTPQSQSGTSAAFSATHAGDASITAHWMVPGLGARAETFSYSIAPIATSVTVNCVSNVAPGFAFVGS